MTRTLDFEKPYDELFDADNRNWEAEDTSVGELEDAFNDTFKKEWDKNHPPLFMKGANKCQKK